MNILNTEKNKITGAQNVEVRRGTFEDLNDILAAYSTAREFMRKTGNPRQWGTNRPSEATVRADISAEINYVITVNGEIAGTFVFFEGGEPLYDIIKEGQWLNEMPYGCIHRVASNGKYSGLLKTALDFASSRAANIRMDTHEDNHVMQHLLEKYGFVRCGKVLADDGTERIAFQLCNEKEMKGI